jgi:hypothetical protein
MSAGLSVSVSVSVFAFAEVDSGGLLKLVALRAISKDEEVGGLG